jgi:hypothetical protein
MPRLVPLFATLFGLSLGAAGLAYAQPAPGASPPAAQQGGCAGMCGMGGQPAQSTPMPGMMQGQGGMMQGGCPMMQRSAALEQRLRRLEERLGVSTPPPGQPGTPPG